MGLADQRYWNSRAETYTQERHLSRADRDVLRLSEIKDNARILEIGVGPGVFTQYLLAHIRVSNVSYIGIEVSTRFIEIFNQRLAGVRGPQVEILRATVSSMPFRPGAFDIIYAMSVLHHLAIENIAEALQSIHCSLRASGQLIVSEDWAFAPKTEFERAAVELRQRLMAHEQVVENHLPAAKWQTLIEDAGFRIKSICWTSRPLDWQRYSVLPDEYSRNLLETLKSTPDEQREVPMVLFDCRKEQSCS